MHCSPGRSRLLCPLSLGLAVGITSAIAILVWSVWVMYYGVSPNMAALNISVPTWKDTGIFTVLALFKGFIFGLLVALFYDLFACCCKSKCCRGGDASCHCGPNCNCGPNCQCGPNCACGINKPKM